MGFLGFHGHGVFGVIKNVGAKTFHTTFAAFSPIGITKGKGGGLTSYGASIKLTPIVGSHFNGQLNKYVAPGLTALGIGAIAATAAEAVGIGGGNPYAGGQQILHVADGISGLLSSGSAGGGDASLMPGPSSPPAVSQMQGGRDSTATYAFLGIVGLLAVVLIARR